MWGEHYCNASRRAIRLNPAPMSVKQLGTISNLHPKCYVLLKRMQIAKQLTTEVNTNTHSNHDNTHNTQIMNKTMTTLLNAMTTLLSTYSDLAPIYYYHFIITVN